MRKLLFTLLASCIGAGTAFGQGVDAGNPFAYAGYTPHLVEGIFAEVVATHPAGMTDASGSTIPAGSVTYRLYIDMLESNDFVTAVGAEIGCSWQLQFNTTTSFYNNAAFGAEIAQGINPGLFGFFGTTQYDTWFTIGAENNTNNCNGNGNVSMAPSGGFACESPTALSFTQAAGIPFCRTDGGYFILNNNNPCGFGTGATNRVLIGQFTTTGTFDWQVGSVTVVENGTPGKGQSYIATTAPAITNAICAGFGNPSLTQYYEYATCIPGFFGTQEFAACAAVAGCTNPAACNFDPAATTDDGSCILPVTPPACVDTASAAYATVLANDPFCCATAWDSVCQAAYNALSPTCLTPCDTAIAINCGTGSIAGTTVGSSNTAAGQGAVSCGTTFGTGGQNWYSFTNGNLNANVTLNTCGSGFDTKIHVFTGSCGALTCVTGNDDFCGLQSSVTFAAAPFQQFWVIVGGFNAAEGAYTLNISCAPNCVTPPVCVDTASAAYSQVISSDPFCCNNSWDSLCQNAYNALNGSCGGCTDPGALNFDANALFDDGSCVYCIVPPACVDVLSSAYSTVIANDSFCCTTGWDSFCQSAYDALNNSCLPQGATCGDAIAITCGTGSVSGTTVGVANDNGTSGAGTCTTTVGTGGQRWYSFTTGGGNQQVTLSTCNGVTNFDTKLHVYTGSCGALTCVAGNDDSACGFGGLLSNVSFAANPATTYFVRVGGFSGDTGNFQLDISCAVICATPPACVNTAGAAYATVIANDPFCCNNSWDSICQAAYDALSSSCNCVNITVNMFDSFGDGWNGASYTITNVATATVVASGTLASGSSGSNVHCLEAGCYTYNVTGGSFPGEVSWNIAGADQAVSGGAPASANFSVNTATCFGCTNPTACNYNPSAFFDNGSCQAPVTPPACVDTASAAYATVLANDPFCCASGWDSLCQNAYNALNNSCIQGCTNPAACNFNAGAGLDDGSCTFPGCTNPAACNFDATAGCDNGSCILPVTPPACVDTASAAYATVLANDPFCCATGWDSLCQNAYNALNGSCLGCTDPSACNFNANAVTNDGSCTYPGCTDPTACNFNAAAGCDDGSCIAAGCTNPAACNFDATAGCDNGSCILPVTPPACVDTASAAYATVLANDPFCCATQWDLLCQNAYDALNSSCLPVCVTPPGCVNTSSACYANVVANDSFCCVTAWDSFCQAAYDACSVTCTGGLTGIPLAATVFPTCNGVPGATSIPGATTLPSNGPFGGNPDDDIVYAISIPCDGAVKVRVDGTGIDAVVELYDGGSNFIASVDATLTGQTEILFANNLAAGNYFVRVYDWFTGIQGAYTICATYYCASTIDFPYNTLTYSACDVTKCQYIGTANGYQWTFIGQNNNDVLTNNSVGNYTFLPLNNLTGGQVQYGETYDVYASAVYTDGDLGTVVASSPNPYALQMNAGPTAQLATSYQNGTFQLNQQIKSTISCGANGYVFQFTSGSTVLTHTVTGTTFLTLCDVAGILPGQTYSVQIAVIYNNVTYGFGPAFNINTAPYAPVKLRNQDNCATAGAVSLGYIIWTSAFSPCAKDYTWEFTPQAGGLPIYKKKGNGVRTLQLSTVAGLTPGETYIVRVKAEFGNYTGNNPITGEPQYDFATAYGATDTICLIGPAAEAAAENNASSVVADEMGATIFPNPASDFFNVSLTNVDESADKVLVDIYDVFGKLVYSEQFASQGASFFANISLNSKFASGVYLVNIKVNETMTTQRLTVTR